jgi:gas vesicle protein
MTQMTDEELRQFLRENKERIAELIKDETEFAKDVGDEVKGAVDSTADRIKEKVSEGKGRAEETFKDIYKAVMDPVAHRHFVRMGLEFFMGLSAIMDKMPMPGPIKEVREDIQNSRESVQKEFCRTNENCAARKGRADDVERIEID